MKAVNQIISIVAVFAGIFVLLITSVEIAAYGDFNYYQKEYEKYQVIEELDMGMDDVMYVTEEMMAYLKGEREELSVYTTIEGEEQDFFNEQDRIHMYDVQQLFIGGMKLRTAALVVLILCIGILLVTRKRWGKMLCRTFWIGLGVFFTALGVLAYLFSQNFNKYFTIFHEIFFDNDLWIFDPAEDYMIRMLPEGFFYDMATRIVMIFGAGLIILLIASIVSYLKLIRRDNNKL
ncbi:MAG: TIGR01906 family membrane protein [Lachnospiraceae bacterium]